MPLDPSLMRFPESPDLLGAFAHGAEVAGTIREQRMRNRLLEMKFQESKEAQDFFQSLMSQGQPQAPGMAPGGPSAPGQAPAPTNVLGGLAGAPPAPGQIDWASLARDPRVQMNPVVAERVQAGLNAQVNAQNAAMNMARTQMETQKFTQEIQQRAGLEQELKQSGRSPSDTSAILRLFDSKAPEALALATEAINKPEKSLAELRSDLRAIRMGGVTEQTIQDIMARNPKLTREQAHMQYQKFQGLARAEGTREAEIELTKRELGDKGLNVWAAQSLFLGKEPSSRNMALASLVKNREAKMIEDIGKRRGTPLTEMDKFAIRGQAQALYGSLQFQQKWADVTYNMSQTLEGMLPQVMKAYNEMPLDVQNQPVRELQQYSRQNLEGSEAVGRFVVLATEMAREYNRILLSGPMGGGGTPGSVEERKVTEDWMAGSMPAKTFLGSMNGMNKGAKIRMQAHAAARNRIMKQMDDLTGGHSADLIAAPQQPPTMLPYLKPDQLEALPLEDLERMQQEQQGMGQF